MNRSGFGGLAAFVGTLVVGVLAGTRFAGSPTPEVTGEPAAAPPTDQSTPVADSQVALKARSLDSLDRPLNEVRAFFGYPRKAQPAPQKEGTDVAEAIRACLHCKAPQKAVREASNPANEIGDMARARGYGLKFLIALVPDPIGSYVGTQFDTYVTALLRGASASHWLLDRHWFPWRDSDSAKPSGNDARPESDGRSIRSPGIILFRYSPPESFEPCNSSDQSKCVLLTVFLVGESPITGVHKQPFVDVLRLISGLEPRIEEVQVLGPFSSGAAVSCALALEAWCGYKEPRPNSITFLSGSATNPAVGDLLRPRSTICPSLKVHFERTVVPDNLLQEKAFEFFERTLDWHSDEIAVLSESDTFYGQQVNRKEGESAHHRGWRLLLPLPSALWSVRTASERSRKQEDLQIGGVKIPAYALDLKLDESRPSRDIFPIFDPMTAPLDELELDALLSTLSREGIRHLGLLFTDVRDKLFIAEKIKRYAPHVSLFTFESSLLFVHPRVNPYTDGMLIISSYPLSMHIQQLLDGFSTESHRLQFGSDAEQGVYNAAVLLTGGEWNPLVADLVTIPGTRFLAPAVWISAVGDGRLVPLALIRPFRKIGPILGHGQQDSAQKGAGPPSGRSPSRRSNADPDLPSDLERLITRLPVAAAFRYCFWVLTVAFAFLSFFYALGYSETEESNGATTDGDSPKADAKASDHKKRSWLPVCFRPLQRKNEEDRLQHYRWTLGLIATISVLWVTVGTVYFVPFVLRRRFALRLDSDQDTDGSRWASLLHGDWFLSVEDNILQVVVRLLPIIAVLLVVHSAYLGWKIGSNGEGRRRRLGAAFLGTAMALALFASYGSLRAFGRTASSGLHHSIFTFLRVSGGPGSLSPLTGILLLATGFALLLIFQLERLRIRDSRACSLPTEQFKESRDIPLRSLDSLHNHLDRRIRQVFAGSARFWFLLIFLLGPFLVAFFFRFEATSDSLLWSRVFAFLFAFLLLPASLAAFSRFASLWRGLRRIIARHEFSDLAPAIERCKKELGWPALRAWGVSRQHTYSTLALSVAKLGSLCSRKDLPDLTPEKGQAAAAAAATLPTDWTTAKDALAAALDADAMGAPAVERRERIKAIEALDSASRLVQKMLNNTDPMAVADSGPRAELTEYLALRAIAYIRYVFAEIRNSLLAFTVGILFLLAGLASFHFQPIRSVYVVLWSVILVVAVWTVIVFIQMDSDTVLSHISGTTPGEINPIKSKFLLRVAAFVLPPVILLIVTQFPQIGRPLLTWMNPLVRFLQ